MRDVMLDLETLGTGTNSAIVQIAAVAFDIETGETGSPFNCYLTLEEQTRDMGRQVNTESIAWWLTMSEAARYTLSNNLYQHSVSPEAALLAFNHFYSNNKVKTIWGNGSTFDVTLLMNLYDASTCLLYTSPSPRDQRGTRMPSSA